MENLKLVLKSIIVLLLLMVGPIALATFYIKNNVIWMGTLFLLIPMSVVGLCTFLALKARKRKLTDEYIEPISEIYAFFVLSVFIILSILHFFGFFFIGFLPGTAIMGLCTYVIFMALVRIRLIDSLATVIEYEK